MLQAFVDESERADIVGLKPDRFNAYGTAEEAAEKRLFCALRFATRKPAAARKCYLSATYGTTESRALIQGFTHEHFFRNL